MSDQLLGQTVAGKYRIEELLGADEMAAVYRARSVIVNKSVLLKVLHPPLAVDPKIVAEFIRQAGAAAGIWHPHMQNVIDYGEWEDGVVFLAMEDTPGRTLKEVIAAEGALPVPRIIRIFRQVCNALEAVHARGLVHQNLRSDRIILEAEDEQVQVKVAGFGITEVKKLTQPEKSLVPSLSATDNTSGDSADDNADGDVSDSTSPEYMSPEQCAGEAAVDARSDIYSLGVILYEMLTGRVPFAGDSPRAVMLKHLDEPALSVLTTQEELAPEVDHVVARAMAKQPAERYQTVGELSRAFVAVAATGALTTAGVMSRATNLDPWRVMIPALGLLVVVFSLLYAVQRGRGSSAAEDQTTLLKSDPNSLPVQPLAAPSGDSERDVAPRPPVVSASAAATPAARTNQNEQSTQEVFPFPVENPNANVNVSSSSSGIAEILREAEGAQPSPSPASKTNTNKNSNSNNNTNQQRTAPTPETVAPPAATDESPPAPSPSPTGRRQRQQTPKAEAQAPTTVPTSPAASPSTVP